MYVCIYLLPFELQIIVFQDDSVFNQYYIVGMVDLPPKCNLL